MSKLPKRKQAWDKLREHNKNYPVAEAFKMIKQAATAKFDEAVDVAINLGIDTKKSDQTVRGSVVLHRLQEKNQATENGARTIEDAMVIDPETTPLLARMTTKGHHIGAPDDNNFEYGLDCILDHASRLIQHGSKSAGGQRKSTAPRQRKSPTSQARAKSR